MWKNNCQYSKTTTGWLFGWKVKFVLLNRLNWWKLLLKWISAYQVSNKSLFLTYYFRKILMGYVNMKFIHTSAEHISGYVTKLIKLWYYEAYTPSLVYIYTETPVRSPPVIDPVVTGEICFAPCWLVHHGGKYKSKQRRGTGKWSHPIYLQDISPCLCANAATNDLNAIILFLCNKLSLMCIKLCTRW